MGDKRKMEETDHGAGPSGTQDQNKRSKKKGKTDKMDSRTYWTSLEHKGPMFTPPYKRLEDGTLFYYDGKPMRLSENAEEVAGFYAQMLDKTYTTDEVFNKNFFNDWQGVMTTDEKKIIVDLSKCCFKKMHNHFKNVSTNLTKVEKSIIKTKDKERRKKYGVCTVDGSKEKISKFKVEAPGLFTGYGDHPKRGKLKKRIMPENVTINCSRDSKIPEPPPGHEWKEVIHDNTVKWLVSWTENVQGEIRYIDFHKSSKLGQATEREKYETARKLHTCIDIIRQNYRADWEAEDIQVRQRAIALYFIDRLVFRVGNEKDEDKADTLGCCSLKVKHIILDKPKDGQEHEVSFDFLGKSSVRYCKKVPVEKILFENLQKCINNKKGDDELFDKLNPQMLNDYLKTFMPNLSCKVFRTYNASTLLQQKLEEHPKIYYEKDKIAAYYRAVRAVAVLCNHQTSCKVNSKSAAPLKNKIQNIESKIKKTEAEITKASNNRSWKVMQRKHATLRRLNDQLNKLKLQVSDRDENNAISLNTSKHHYLDPRITVAWCKKNNVPIRKIYTTMAQRNKFNWAIVEAGSDFVF